jgi:DNA-binding MarR family transcriptional regulator
MHAAIREAGFADLQEAHFSVFSYPLPDGVRPSDLARRMHMSRQAANYLIGQMEELGYLERRAGPGSDRRLVHLTDRGWQVAEVIYASLRRLQEEWAEEVGQERFGDFMAVLREIAAREAR